MTIDEVFALIKEKGENIMQADIDEIHIAAVEFNDEDRERLAWAFESLFLTINDKRYKGDAKPLD